MSAALFALCLGEDLVHLCVYHVSRVCGEVCVAEYHG